MDANAFIFMRFSQTPDEAALRRVWVSLSQEQRDDPKVLEYKNHYKEQLRREKL